MAVVSVEGQSRKGEERERSWEPRLSPGGENIFLLFPGSSKERSRGCTLETQGQQKVSWDTPTHTQLPFVLIPQPAVAPELGLTSRLPRFLVTEGRRRGSEQCCTEWRNDPWRKR